MNREELLKQLKEYKELLQKNENKQGNTSNSKAKTKSYNIKGRENIFAKNPGEQGYLVLGFMAFIIEISFLAISYLIFR